MIAHPRYPAAQPGDFIHVHLATDRRPGEPAWPAKPDSHQLAGRSETSSIHALPAILPSNSREACRHSETFTRWVAGGTFTAIRTSLQSVVPRVASPTAADRLRGFLCVGDAEPHAFVGRDHLRLEPGREEVMPRVRYGGLRPGYRTPGSRCPGRSPGRTTFRLSQQTCPLPSRRRSREWFSNPGASRRTPVRTRRHRRDWRPDTL